MTTTTLVKPTAEREVSFIPFGAADAIKLSVNIVRRLIAVNTKSGKPPTDEDCMKFIMMCQAKRANPFEGDAYLLGYDTQKGPQFSFVTAHQLYLKRAEQSVDYDGMDSGVIVLEQDGTIKDIDGDFYTKEQVVIGGWAKVYHKKRSHPIYRRIRLERFNKGFGQWGEDAAGMICKCAEADALRSTFPTMLGGLYTREEVIHNIPTVVETEPKFSPQIVDRAEDAPEVERPKRRNARAATEPSPTPTPEPSPSSPTGVGGQEPVSAPQSSGSGSETPRQRLMREIFTEAKVPFEDLQEYLANQRICPAARDYPGADDLPVSVWEYLDKNPGRVEQIVRLYNQV